MATVVALLLAVSAITPLVASPRIRAGVVRKIRIITRPAGYPEASQKIDVPILYQERALSCEAATLRMALAYRGVTVTEQELLDAIGRDPTPRTRTSAGIVWGDPDEAFVGNVDGVIGRTGYGVHAGPIGRVAGQYRRTEVLTGASPQALADAIATGNPVIVWGHLTSGRPMTWRTPGGKTIHAINGEHTRVVVGYTGRQEEPTGFHLNDPIYGRQYWKLEKFMKNWEKLGRSAVVVY